MDINRLKDLFQSTLQVDLPQALLAAAVVILTITLYFLFRNRGLPPGPTGLPYLGYWPFLRSEDLPRQLEELSRKYGDVSSLTVTGRLYVNLASMKAMREAQVTQADCFASRVEDFSLLTHFFKDGISMTRGEQWKTLRKFFISQFKEKGLMSAKEMFDAMSETVRGCVEQMRANDADVDVMALLCDKSNAIMRDTLLRGGGATEKQIRDINDAYAVVVASMLAANTLLIGPLARYLIFPLMASYRNALKHNKIIEQNLHDIVDDHKKRYKPDNVRDLVDAFFKERDDRRSKGDSTAEHFTDEALVGSLYQFMGDGVLAVAALAASFLKFATDHPAEQEKMHAEIASVVGTDRLPTLDDKSKLSYTNAFINEILRTSDFLVLFPSMECTKETSVGGYRIPKGAITMVNFWCIHHDPGLYEDPEKFNPSRFLPGEGRTRPELPVTFGMGKRACIGESFTMAQVFLFLTSIIQNFRLTLPEGVTGTTIEVIIAGDMKIKAHPRSLK